LQSSLAAGKVTADFPIYECPKCNKETIFRICEQCNKKTIQMYFCKICGKMKENVCKKHGICQTYSNRAIEIKIFC